MGIGDLSDMWIAVVLCALRGIGAGLIKIRGDKVWRDLTAMDYHYETQPLPNPVSYFLHQAPKDYHRYTMSPSAVGEGFPFHAANILHATPDTYVCMTYRCLCAEVVDEDRGDRAARLPARGGTGHDQMCSQIHGKGSTFLNKGFHSRRPPPREAGKI